MAQDYPAFALADEWQDVFADPTYAALAGQEVTVQARGSDGAYIYFSASGTEPGAEDGAGLYPLKTRTGSAAHLFVRGGGSLAIWQEY